MKLSDVVGMEVVSHLGDRLGRVVDLRCAGEPEVGEERPHRVVTEVVFGRVGWLERMGFRAVGEEIVPWAEIETFGTTQITLKRD
jgi:sporulation protein YlmC with PRC-barrel domain